MDSSFNSIKLRKVKFSVDDPNAYWSSAVFTAITSQSDVDQLSTQLLNLDTSLNILVSFPVEEGEDFLGQEHVAYNDDAFSVQEESLK